MNMTFSAQPSAPAMLDVNDLKRAFSLVASGVTIVTARDSAGRPHGFTASSFTPLSVAPPMMLVCVGTSARCHAALIGATYIGVNVLRPDHKALAFHFASKAGDKFEGQTFADGPFGSPLLPGAAISFEGRIDGRHPGGDHTVLTAMIEHMALKDEGEIMTYFARGFSAMTIPPRP